MKVLLCLFILFLSTGFLFANTGDEEGEMPWDGPLKKIMNALTGRTAMTISVIAIAGSGFLLMTGEGGGAKRQMGWVILGIAIAMNAPRVVKLLFPEGMIL